MGQIGRFIDNATDAERDRVIEGMHWTSFWVEEGCNCLIGHMQGLIEDENGLTTSKLDYHYPITGEALRVGLDVMWLFERFTIDRIVPMLKARAAKNNHVDTSAQIVNRLNRITSL